MLALIHTSIVRYVLTESLTGADQRVVQEVAAERKKMVMSEMEINYSVNAEMDFHGKPKLPPCGGCCHLIRFEKLFVPSSTTTFNYCLLSSDLSLSTLGYELFKSL